MSYLYIHVPDFIKMCAHRRKGIQILNKVKLFSFQKCQSHCCLQKLRSSKMGFQADSEAMSAAYNVTYRYFKKKLPKGIRRNPPTTHPPKIHHNSSLPQHNYSVDSLIKREVKRLNIMLPVTRCHRPI